MKYRVIFQIIEEVEADNEDEAEAKALEEILSWDWRYVNDYLKLKECKQID